jgi:hypothetical protein
MDDRDPAKSTSVPGGLHARNIGELDESIGRHAHAEPPLFRLAGLEVCEFPASDRVDEKVVRLAMQRLDRPRKRAAEPF